MLELTFNNVVLAEQAGVVDLLAFNPNTGEEFPISSEKFTLMRAFPDTVIKDERGEPFYLTMAVVDVMIVAIEA